MTPAQIRLVQDSWQLVLPIKDKATEIFYQRLFETEPHLRALFPAELGPQRMKLATMLNAAVNGLSDLPSLVPVVRQLGSRHASYGVKDEHYPMVGSALIWTLAAGLGEAFTPDVRQAWTQAYSVLSSVMIDASREERVAGA